MARISIHLSDSEEAIVASERDSHPDFHVRRKMLVLWSVHTGLTRLQAAKVAGVGRATPAINATRWFRVWLANWASDFCSCRRTPRT